jgi:AraC-like DNA-binding protein
MERLATVPQHETPPAGSADVRRQHGLERDGRAPVDSVFSSISCSVLDARHHQFGPEWDWLDERVPHYRLFVCLGGEALLAIGGEVYRLARGGTLLVPPHAPHHSVPAASPADPDGAPAEAPHRPPLRGTATDRRPKPLIVYVVDFTARFHGLLDVAAFCQLPVALRPSPLRWPKLLSSAHCLVHHLSTRMPGYELALHTHCVRLLDLLWKETLAQTEGRPPAAQTRTGETTRLLPVFQIIESRAAERVTLGELARAAHLHPAYLSTLFKKVTGLSPLHYLAQYRLQRVRDLLLGTDHPVGEIAVLTGFYDAAHLIRVFQRAEGTSPGRYRRLRRPKERPNLH